jgi:threonine/homoserine efflux transporter RhtA
MWLMGTVVSGYRGLFFIALGRTGIAVTGLAMLTLGSEQVPDPVGILAALGAAASCTAYTVFGARLARDGYDSSAVMVAPFAIAAVLLVPVILPVARGGCRWMASLWRFGLDSP